jgi:hypothetical protein
VGVGTSRGADVGMAVGIEAGVVSLVSVAFRVRESFRFAYAKFHL